VWVGGGGGCKRKLIVAVNGRSFWIGEVYVDERRCVFGLTVYQFKLQH